MARTKEAAKTVVDPYQNVRATVEREDDEVQIDLMELLYRLIEKMRYIVTATVACALAAALITMLFISPKYTATAKLYVKNGSGSGINLSDLQIGNYLASDYTEVFSNWHVHEQVIENLNLPYDYDQMNEMIDISNPNDTRILYISVTSKDAREAQQIANEYARVAQEFIADKMETSEPSVFEEALLPSKPTSPSLTKNTLLGFFAGLLCSCGFFVVQFLLDDRIRTSEDIERISGLTTLGMMPVQSAERARQEKKEIRRQLQTDARNERRAEMERSKRV